MQTSRAAVVRRQVEELWLAFEDFDSVENFAEVPVLKALATAALPIAAKPERRVRVPPADASLMDVVGVLRRVVADSGSSVGFDILCDLWSAIDELVMAEDSEYVDAMLYSTARRLVELGCRDAVVVLMSDGLNGPDALEAVALLGPASAG